MSPEIAIAEAFAVRKAWAASMWPRWRGHIGSTGVEERSKGTGRIAWRPERSHSRPNERSRKVGRPVRSKPGPGRDLRPCRSAAANTKAGGIGWAAEANP